MLLLMLQYVQIVNSSILIIWWRLGYKVGWAEVVGRMCSSGRGVYCESLTLISCELGGKGER